LDKKLLQLEYVKKVIYPMIESEEYLFTYHLT